VLHSPYHYEESCCLGYADRMKEMSPSQSARELALHLAQNPFLEQAQLPLAFGSAIGLEGLASLAGRTTHRSLVLQSSQVLYTLL